MDERGDGKGEDLAVYTMRTVPVIKKVCTVL